MSAENEALEAPKKENPFGTEKISKLLLVYSLPGIVSMVVNSIYNMVDQIFIGQGVGYLGNAATNVTFPFMQLMLALGAMTAVGTASNSGLCLGRKEEDEADHYFGNGLALAITLGLAVLIIGQVFNGPLLRFFGATDLVMPYAVTYSRIVMIGFPFVSCGMYMNNLVRLDGSPTYAMIAMLTGAVLNIILDPLFIMVFHWGVAGAAIATVIGQIATFILMTLKMRNMKVLTLRREYMRMKWEYIRGIIAIGMSAFLSNIVMLFSNILMNNQAVHYGELSIYGAEIPLTCFGIVLKINSLMTAIILGITHASQPIFSYNFGAKKYDRVAELMIKGVLATFVVGLIGFFVFRTFPEQIISLFGQEDALYNEFAVMCMLNMTLLLFVIGIPMLAGVYFQAVGRPVVSIILSLSRNILFAMPAMVILPMFVGIKGVMWSFPVGDAASIVLSGILLGLELRHLRRMQAEPDPGSV